MVYILEMAGEVGGRGPLESMEWVGSDEFGLSKTSYCAFSEMTREDPAFKFFVTSWIIGLINGYSCQFASTRDVPQVNSTPKS